MTISVFVYVKKPFSLAQGFNFHNYDNMEKSERANRNLAGTARFVGFLRRCKTLIF
jgi:hypothetical protein